MVIRFAATPTSAKPDAPASLDVVEKNKKVQLVWTAPARDGGSPVTGYRVEYQQAGAASWTAGQRACSPLMTETSTLTSCDLTGLINGQSYCFRVAAINAIGRGDWAMSRLVNPAKLGTK